MGSPFGLGRESFLGGPISSDYLSNQHSDNSLLGRDKVCECNGAVRFDVPLEGTAYHSDEPSLILKSPNDLPKMVHFEAHGISFVSENHAHSFSLRNLRLLLH